MTCDDCERNRQIGNRYCTTCGSPLEMAVPQPETMAASVDECIAPVPDQMSGCPECEKNRMQGRNFCTTCGRQLADDVPRYEEPAAKEEGYGWVLPIPGMIVMIVALVFSLACLFMYIGDVWRYVYDIKISIYVFFILEFDLGYVTGQAAQFYWLFIAVVAVASSILVIWFSRGAFSGFRSPGYKERLERTPLYNLGLFFGATLVVEIAIAIIMQGLGVSIVTPEVIEKFTPTEYAFYMARAGVWEEIAFRLVPIGLPMALIALVMGRKDFLKHLLGGFGMSRVAFVLLVISSVIFAYAHVGMWGNWKMATVLISAFALGYLYIRFGIYVSIVFHFITDYTSVWAVVNESMAGMLELIIIMLGVICIPLAVKKMVEGLGALKTAPNVSFDQYSKDLKKD